MSRSFRKTIGLYNKKLSEKLDKKISSKKIRRITNTLLSVRDINILESTIFPIDKEISDNYYFSKDDMRFLLSSIGNPVLRKKYSSK